MQENKKCEKYLRSEIKFENRVKDKKNFFINRNIPLLFFFKQKYILFFEKYS